MATINSPAAGVSPYQEAAAAPVVLRADANGNTVLANPTVTATAAAAATNANSNVIVNGNEALNSLIATSRSGVFEGANVTINLEEQLFNTTNQVTATTNYPSGNIGEIQFNSGSNSFASNAYFTYDNSNVVTPGIRTDGYFYSNGAPFIGGGNAAIGNFVFTGDNMTIAHANSTLSVTGNGTGNVNVTANGNTWTFGNNRILTLPGGPRIVPVGSNLELQAAAGGYAEITDSTGNTYVSVNSSGAQIVANSSNTWAFNNNGTTQFPGNLLHPPAGNPLDIQVTVGNAYSTVSLYETGSQLIIQDNTTGPNPAWALFEADLANVNTPQAVVILKPGDTGDEVRWYFDATGNLTLPGNTFAVNYANNQPVSLSGVTLVPNDVTYQTGSLYGNANAGFTVVTTGDDDASYNVPIDFPIEFLGNTYTNGNVYLVSNSYLTFGSGLFENYIPVGPGVVSVPAIFVGATDLSNQKYYYGYADGTDVYVIGYEGSNDTSGETDYPNITWEMQVNSAAPDQIKIVTNFTAQQPGGVWGVSNGAEWVDQIQPLPWYSNYADSTFNSILIAPVTPQAATNIAFTGPGVTIGQDSGTTYVNIDPFDSVISVGTGGEGGSASLSSVYADLILTTPTDGSGIYVVPQGTAYIKGGNASNTHPGNGYDVSLVGGNAHDNPNNPGQDYGGGNITLLTGSAVGNSRPGQISFGVGNSLWFFAPTGGTRFPNLTVERGDNPSGTIQGQTLLFSDPSVEAIISTPDGTVGNEYSQRLVINPGAGNNYGEGGDIYLWAGRGGDGSGTGGDIKIRGGQGGANTQGGVGGAGGYVRIEAGDAGGVYNGSTGPIAGFIEMTAGAGGENQTGGYIRILGGTGSDGNYPGVVGGGDANIQGGYGRVNAPGGNVNLVGGISANGLADYGRVNISSGASTWVFDNAGNLTTPGVSGNITGANVISANVFTAPNNGNVEIFAGGDTWTFAGDNNIILPATGGLRSVDNTINLRTQIANSYVRQYQDSTHWEVYADDDTTAAYQASAWINAELPTTETPLVFIETQKGSDGIAHRWIFGSNGNLTFPTGNLVITPDAFDLSNAAVISSADHNLITLSTGANGGTSSLWVEDYANIGSSNIAAVYANPVPGSGNVRIAVGTNGGGGPNLWDFQPNGNLTAPGNISTTGNITGAYFFGNGSQLTSVSVPSQNILPTIQTITVADTSGVGNAGGGGSAFANVTVANTIPVTEYGVIITDGTSSQKYATGALGSIPGTVQLTFTTGLNSASFTVYAYVTSNAGTYYSNAATGTSGICLLAGTQISLSDGTYKAIEDITYTDKLLSWDFDRGCYAETTALWIKRSETGSQYNLLTFSDGTTLRTFDQHRIFNKQAGAFTYPMTDATPIGTVTVNEHGQEITLTNKQVIKDTIEYYNVITDYHMNLFSDSVLTSCRFNNIYPITDMKFVKDTRTLRTRAEFENVEDRFFHGLRLAEQTADIETVEWYVNRLLATEVLTQVELAD